MQASQIDGIRLEVTLEQYFNAEVLAPALPARLMLEVLYFKPGFNLCVGDDSRWNELEKG